VTRFRIGDLSIFFLSFDEPWADEFFTDLRAKAPQARRVHGVIGHDNAIKACARRSRTERFLTVDADNLIRPELLDLVVDDTDMPRATLSFRGRNVLNGLEYGNGGPACWPRSTALEMRTHAAARDTRAQVDFCWSTPTFVMDAVGSDVHVNRTPYHAFRAGYREAVKMTLIDGEKPASLRLAKQLAVDCNRSRLMMWASVGADVPHGVWAIYGVRRALFDVWVDDLPITCINDYAWFDAYWSRLSRLDPQAEAVALGAGLNARFDLGIQDLTPEVSRWAKDAYLNPTWSGFVNPVEAAPATDRAA